jgi:hypothetical protein
MSCLSGIVARDQRDADDGQEQSQGQSKRTIHNHILSQNVHGEETTPGLLPSAANLRISRLSLASIRRASLSPPGDPILYCLSGC